MFAASHNHLEIIQLLLSQSVAVDSRNHNQWTALMFACKAGNTEIARILIEQGHADVNIVNRFQEYHSALALASRYINHMIAHFVS